MSTNDELPEVPRASVPRRRGSKRDASPVPALLTAHEAAEALGCSEWWVKEQARNRRIPYSWIGGSYRFLPEHVLAIIRLFEVTPGSGTASSATKPPARRRLALSAGKNADTAPQLRSRPPAGPRAAQQGPPAA